MTRQVNLYEAKTNLSQLVEDAAKGEEIIIAKNGKPMVKLVAAVTPEEAPKNANLASSRARSGWRLTSTRPTRRSSVCFTKATSTIRRFRSISLWKNDATAAGYAHILVSAPSSGHKRAPLKSHIVAAIVDPSNEVTVSLASAWELCIKSAIGKLLGDASLLIGSQESFESVLNDSRFALLQIRPEHIFMTRQLPLHHRDPFDRLIVAQAITERMTLVTADRRLEAYEGLDMIVGA